MEQKFPVGVKQIGNTQESGKELCQCSGFGSTCDSIVKICHKEKIQQQVGENGSSQDPKCSNGVPGSAQCGCGRKAGIYAVGNQSEHDDAGKRGWLSIASTEEIGIGLAASRHQTPSAELCETTLRRKVYECLEQLEIPYERVDTEEAITMEDCEAIDAKLQMKTVKTLFLCNRQQTKFYLFVTRGDKSFKSKNFSAALGVSRVSFAPEEKMEEMMENKIGETTVFGALMDPEQKIQVVIDKEVADSEWYGCSDGVTTGYMKLKTKDILEKVLNYAKHEPKIIEIACE